MRRKLRHALPASLLATALSGCAAPSPARLVAGDTTLEVLPGERALRLLRGAEVLLTFPSDGLQLGTVPMLDPQKSYDPYWMEYGEEVLSPSEPDDLRWHAADTLTVVRQAADAIEAELALASGVRARLTLRAEAPDRFSALLQPAESAGRAVALVRLRARADSQEAFYGMGEWPDEVNHRGKVRPMQIELDNTESANNENHVPVPLLIGTRGWGLFAESRRVGVFAVANKEPDLIEVSYGTAEASADGLRFHLFAAPRPLDVLRHYYDVTGYPQLPAYWALGPWIWRDESRDQAQVLDDIQKIRGLDLATSAIWVDRPYETAVGAFDFNPAQFPDPPAMIKAAHDAGLRFALWSVPYVEKSAGAIRAEAEQRGFFPPKAGLLLNPWSDPVDLTKAEVYARWQELVRRYTSMGVEGFKLDYAEDIAPGVGPARNVWRFADGSDERTMHYGYTPLYHRVYAETLPDTGGFLLCRAGRYGGHVRASVIWPGDMDATFTRHRERFAKGDGKEVVGVGGLPATVAQGLNLAASGYPFFAADTGGYRHSPPDGELFIRWFEQTALSGVMEVGDSSSTTPWEYAQGDPAHPELLAWYRQYARLHLRLFPYEWTFAQRIRKDGRPIVRALGLAHPELGVHPPDVYLFGEDLLVAPVVDRGQTRRQVPLPAGEWLDWWDGTVYSGDGGGQADVAAPLGKLPLLVRAGAAVPLLRPTIDTLSPAVQPGVESFAERAGPLYWRLVPGPAETSFTLYDGGELRHGPRGVTIKAGTVFREATVLERVRTATPQRVQLDGAPLERRAGPGELEAAPRGWAWTPEQGGTLWIKVPAGDHQIEL